MKQEFVTLPRAVVEQAIAALTDLAGWRAAPLCDLLRAALEQPPTAEQSSVVEQQQGEQEPVAWIENVEGAIGYDTYHEAARKLPDGVRFDLYTHSQNLRCKSNQARLATLWGYEKPQPKRETLTDEQSRRIYDSATYAASLDVFMTRVDAEHPDADDKGVSGWLQEAEYRVKSRITEAAHNIK